MICDPLPTIIFNSLFQTTPHKYIILSKQVRWLYKYYRKFPCSPSLRVTPSMFYIKILEPLCTLSFHSLSISVFLKTPSFQIEDCNQFPQKSRNNNILNRMGHHDWTNPQPFKGEAIVPVVTQHSLDMLPMLSPRGSLAKYQSPSRNMGTKQERTKFL